jgi:hypothetical protein
MVVGFCPGVDQANHGVVASVCLVCHGAASRGESGNPAVLRGDQRASALLRRVVSRRRSRCELSLVSAMISLLHQDPGLYDHLVLRIKLKLEGDLANVS